MQTQMYNLCGVPDSEWKCGICKKCKPAFCDMADNFIIPIQVYEWAKQKNLIHSNTTFKKKDLVNKIKAMIRENKNVPQHVIDFAEAESS